MITGKDPISLQVLEAFTQKQKLSDIAAAFILSLDQVKRLKRLYNYTNTVRSLTIEQTTEQFKQLGTKGLFLSPYIKAKDALAVCREGLGGRLGEGGQFLATLSRLKTG